MPNKIECLLKNCIAVTALAISAWLLYKDYIQPFQLDVRPAGRITISKNPFSEGLSQDSIQLDLIFTNQGARRGIIEDVAVVINANGKQSIFRSLAEQTDRSLNLQKDLVPPKLESFIGFQLAKSESLIHRIFFVPHSASAIVQLSIGTYDADVWVKSTESKKWIKKDFMNFTIDAEDIESLGKSKMTPLPEGGYFIKMITRDKVLSQGEERLKELTDIISNQSK